MGGVLESVCVCVCVCVNVSARESRRVRGKGVLESSHCVCVCVGGGVVVLRRIPLGRGWCVIMVDGGVCLWELDSPWKSAHGCLIPICGRHGEWPIAGAVSDVPSPLELRLTDHAKWEAPQQTCQGAFFACRSLDPLWRGLWRSP